MTTPLQLELDPSNYLQGLSQADQGTANFATNVRTAALAMGPFAAAMHGLTPSRALLGGMGALAAGAADVQAQLATMSAQAKVTHANMGQLTSGMRSLARDLPVGNAGARQITQALTSMGISAKGAESQVGALARVFSNLSGGTGEGAAGLAQGFVNLNRVMGTGTSAKTMSNLADSLTTVSAKSGASATSILAFSKAIAPMAQASGIGETKVLGISAAFSKLGDDGLGAATAFNKMLTDLNHSVREGSPGLSAYANIVGKTSDQFASLMKSNPTEALTQVFEKVGKNPNAPRLLESIGLDGVRTQRYIQSLAASGGLRQSISDAADSYGNGNTNKAAQVAFSGLADATQRAAANAGQLGDAIGTPLLRPLTAFTNMLGAAVTPLRAMAGSKVGQGAITTAAYGALAFGLLPRLLRGLGIAQLAGSGPVRSMFAGAAIQRAGGADEALRARGGLGGFLRVAGGNQISRVVTGEELGKGLMGRLNPRTMEAGAGMARMFGLGGRPTTGVGLGSLLRGGVGVLPSLITNAYAETARLARTPVAEREFRGTPRGPFTATGRMFQSYADDMERARTMQGPMRPGERERMVSDARTQLREQIASRGIVRGWGGAALVGGANVAGQSVLSAGSLLGRGLGVGGRALGPIGGGIGAAIMGGGYLYHQVQAANQRDAAGRQAELSAPTFVDAYRIAMGKATEATSTFAGKLQSTADAMGKTVTSFGQVNMNTPEALVNARAFKGKPAGHFAGNQAAVVATLSRQVRNGMKPDELQRAIYDLSNQTGWDATRAQAVLDAVRADSGQSLPSLIGTQVAGLAGVHQSTFRGILSSAGIGDNLTGGQRDAAHEISRSIFDTRATQTGPQGATKANKTAMDSINAAIKASMKGNNADLTQALLKDFFNEAGVKYDGNIDLEQEKGWNSFGSVQDLLTTGKYGKDWKTAGQKFLKTFDTTGDAAPTLSYTGQTLRDAGSDERTRRVFGGGSRTASGQAFSALMSTPESPQLQTQWTQAFLSDGRKAGASLSDLAAQALKAATALTDGTDQGKAAFAAFNAAAQQISANIGGLRPGQQAQAQAGLSLQKAQIVPTDATSQGMQQAGVQELQQEYNQAVQIAQQRLQNQQQYQIASERSEADYLRTRGRANDSFNRQVARADEDYRRDVGRARRDFARTQAREAEDAAKSMYDPYTRIAAKGVWDVNNLNQNMREQNRAMQNQMANLATARRAGLKNSTITLLGLNDPDNAQQLASMIGKLVSDPSVVRSLNSTAATRKSLAGQLLGDPSDANYQRQIQDFHTQLGDMAVNFRTATVRSRQDFNIQMGQMANDYATMVKRARQDLATADQVLTSDLGKLTKALATAAKGQMVDFKTITSDGLNDWIKLLQQFQTGPFQAALAGLSYTVTVAPAVPAESNPKPKGGNPATRDLPNDNKPAGSDAPPAPKPKAAPKPKPNPAAGGLTQDIPQHGKTITGARTASYVTRDTAFATGTGTTNITVVHDTGVKVLGAVTIPANDPQELGRKLALRAARERSSLPAQLR